VAKITKIIHNY